MGGRGVLITGGSGDIGAAIVRRFASDCDHVAVHYASGRERAEGVVASLPADGHLAIQADITQHNEARRLVEDAVAALGQLDVLVNNAGISEPFHPVLDSSYEQWQEGWRRIIQLNLIGTTNVTFCAVQHMRERGGRIVNVGSRGAFRGSPYAPAYAASKAGLHAFGQTLALTLAGVGISVTTVAPGPVEGGMAADYLAGPQGEAVRAESPFGRVATPDEVADAVAYLASPGAEFASGTIVDLNGASYLRP
ncbi:epimerase [Longimycelium tulufanense]|uniref:Epimerase n=1 Tax=Longimycelium tulufanense TaxID=907463 RepID=A0A8J3CIJ5_9PSEU|nr:SDR family NAD(P)-dependent oxidoreductase [Longimycelium tulufanense]GGM72027.1 epimerase [Longimycelium tulufanense]